MPVQQVRLAVFAKREQKRDRPPAARDPEQEWGRAAEVGIVVVEFPSITWCEEVSGQARALQIET